MTQSETSFFDFVSGYRSGSTGALGRISDDGADAVASLVVGSCQVARIRRLRLYSERHFEQAYSELVQQFETTHQALGTDRFERVVRLYLRTIPVTSPRLRWLGQGFSEFLRHRSLKGLLRETAMPWLSDIAELDWARGLVSDAPEEPPLLFEKLRRLLPQDCSQLRVSWRPCVQRLNSTHDILKLQRQINFAPCSGIQATSRRASLVPLGPLEGSSLPTAKRIVLTDVGGHCVERELSANEASLFDRLEQPQSLTEFSQQVARQFDLTVAGAARRSVAYLQAWCDGNTLQLVSPRGVSAPSGDSAQ